MRGAERKPSRRRSGEKGKLRRPVCASKRRIKGLRGWKRKPSRRRSGKKGKLRLRVCASKRRIKGLRGTERKPRRQEKSRRPPLVSGGRRRRHINTIHLSCSGNLWPGRMFFCGKLSDDFFEAAGNQICQDHFHRIARKERYDACHQRGLDVASRLENKPCASQGV